VNHADLLRNHRDETKAEAVLRQALEVIPENGDVHHALGLSLVRQKRTAEAVAALEQAVRLSPNNARYVYVYAVALNSIGYRYEKVVWICQVLWFQNICVLICIIRT
jgi:Flp pilus assembly protein TadD